MFLKVETPSEWVNSVKVRELIITVCVYYRFEASLKTFQSHSYLIVDRFVGAVSMIIEGNDKSRR